MLGFVHTDTYRCLQIRHTLRYETTYLAGRARAMHCVRVRLYVYVSVPYIRYRTALRPSEKHARTFLEIFSLYPFGSLQTP